MEPKQEDAELNVHDEESNCRFYRDQYPKENELVMVKITDVNEYATVVQLLEYANIEGYITPNEYTRQSRHREITKVRKKDKQEICMVIRVDEKNGFIDLSKKRVPAQDVKKTQEKFLEAKKIQTIMRTVKNSTSITVPELYEKVVWPLQDSGSSVHDIFFTNLNSLDSLFEKIDIPQDVKDKLKDELIRRLTPEPVKICAQILLTCLSIEGVDAIKEALQCAEDCSTRDIEISVTVDSAPHYRFTSITKQRAECIALMEKAFKKVEESIKKNGGHFEIKEQPSIIGKNQGIDFADKLKDIEEENDDYEFED